MRCAWCNKEIKGKKVWYHKVDIIMAQSEDFPFCSEKCAIEALKYRKEVKK